ncbi:MAG TPA: 4-hydroxy-tetrahydrodipicolinate reductase [Candidatus Cybelea sp.]|nr:4-hydroxy-tetrahydrodipicolinate reductase [Candidatus Cybelea sp.]
MADIKIGIVGAAGRMGIALARQIAATSGCVLVGGTERDGAASLGRDLGEVAGIGPVGRKITNDPLALFADADVVLDFTAPAASVRHAEIAAQAKCALVVGTTGLEEAHLAAIGRAARHTAIVQSYNMCLGVNLLSALTRQLAKTLDPDFDIEIVEMHHRLKVDAPSGTAIMLGEAAAAGRGVKLAEVSDRGRDGITGARKRGHIGFAALRGGNVVGDHSVIFAADNERIELVHKAADRAIFARGAVRAALWTRGKPPGLYHMNDVLGL